ncbi:acyl carrier protein [Anaeroselena agilis]|uniref:Phosphopantetheine-binding protein n=1 Tax=Anaeroselena agilis TaxID=3063788 RepID=A0ABU3P522_9FIRM|nr:phosphopantetheine-binding protein [Selenomonadales bacterium 4137-cl]
MDKQQIASLTRDIVAKRLPQVSPDKITPEAEFAVLGVDSLALSWMLADIEDTFEIEMQIGDAMKLKNTAAVVDYVAKRLAE